MEFFIGKSDFSDTYLFFKDKGTSKHINRLNNYVEFVQNHTDESIFVRKPTLREIYKFKNNSLFEEVLKDYINNLT